MGNAVHHADSPTARARFGLPPVCNYKCEITAIFQAVQTGKQRKKGTPVKNRFYTVFTPVAPEEHQFCASFTPVRMKIVKSEK